MGEARRRRLTGASNALDRAAVERVGAALRKIAVAASGNLGSDCYTHAAIGQCLLADLGIGAEITAGYAAWRVGNGDGSVIAHTPDVVAYLPKNAKGFPYHAWLSAGQHLIDFSTYQLRAKAAQLDAADGGTTDVVWCPDLLILDERQIASFSQVRQGAPGAAYYERCGETEGLLAYADRGVDPMDLRAARLVLANPEVVVIGPR